MPTPVQISELLIDDVVSFHLHGNTTIPNITNGVVLGITSGNNLTQPGLVAATHANIYGALPEPKPPNTYTKYQYLVVRTQDGVNYEIGYPWIVKETLTRAERAVATVILRDFDTSKLPMLKSVLETHGFVTTEIIITE